MTAPLEVFRVGLDEDFFSKSVQEAIYQIHSDLQELLMHRVSTDAEAEEHPSSAYIAPSIELPDVQSFHNTAEKLLSTGPLIPNYSHFL